MTTVHTPSRQPRSDSNPLESIGEDLRSRLHLFTIASGGASFAAGRSSIFLIWNGRSGDNRNLVLEPIRHRPPSNQGEMF